MRLVENTTFVVSPIGPAVGPLVMAGVIYDKKLENLGIKDSKLLTKDKRDELYDKIIEFAEHKILVVDPAEIDKAVMSDSYNLNFLEADTSIKIIKALKSESAIIDCPSTNVPAYTKYLQDDLEGVNLVVEHKADMNHMVVGAASILAKVTRDRLIEVLKKESGVDFGSGYPSDPKTKEFLRNHTEEHLKFIRKSWAPYKKVVIERNQTTLGSF